MPTGNIKPPNKRASARSTKPRHPASSKSKHARAVQSGLALRKALLSLLQTTPFEQITIRDICTKARVHYATFFRHHQTKNALLDHIAKDQIKQLNKLTLAVRKADNYEAGFCRLCVYVAEHRSMWSILLNGGAGFAMREEWLQQSRRVSAAEPPMNTWLPASLGTICAATLIAETLAWWVGQPEDAYTPEQIAKILYRLVITSVMAPD